MASSTDTSSTFSAALATAGADSIRESLKGKYACPFCGSVNDSEQGMCPRCTMENSAATRKATKTRIGPWYVLQTRNPAAPGMTFETLLSFVRKGRVKARSIVRGPTTHQLWRFAAQVKGLSREFGICYSCGVGIETTASLCATCNRLQDPPPNPDALLEASREAQQSLAHASPTTVDGSVLAAPGPDTIVSQTTSTRPVAAPPIHDGDFVIQALGSGNLGMSAGGVTAVAPAAPAAATASLASPSDFVAATQQTPIPGEGSVSGIPGDSSWARIGGGARPRPQRQPAAAPANGAKFNPYADDDSRTSTSGEGFLSAKDLAAAFNLGFVGEDEENPAQRPAGPAPRAIPGFPSPMPARRFGLGKFLMVVIFVLGAAYLIAIAVSPTFREDSFAWLRRQAEALTQHANVEQTDGSPAKPKASNPKRGSLRQGVETAAPGEQGADPTVLPGTNPLGQADLPIPAAGQPATSASDDAAASDWLQSPAAKLWGEAFELRETDPQAALRKLEQIKQLPPSEHPSNLDDEIRRLKAAGH